MLIKEALEDLQNIAELARKRGILNEVAFRNMIIKLEFEQMKLDFPNEPVDILMQKLADKKRNEQYLSFETIRQICYPKGENKAKMELAIQLVEEIKELPKTDPKMFVKRERRTYARRR